MRWRFLPAFSLRARSSSKCLAIFGRDQRRFAELVRARGCKVQSPNFSVRQCDIDGPTGLRRSFPSWTCRIAFDCQTVEGQVCAANSLDLLRLHNRLPSRRCMQNSADDVCEIVQTVVWIFDCSNSIDASRVFEICQTLSGFFDVPVNRWRRFCIRQSVNRFRQLRDSVA